jgi:hypothetical protein
MYGNRHAHAREWLRGAIMLVIFTTWLPLLAQAFDIADGDAEGGHIIVKLRAKLGERESLPAHRFPHTAAKPQQSQKDAGETVH